MDYRLEQFRYELREDPSSRVFFKLGEVLRREGELEEAIAVLDTGLEQHPKYVAAWVSLGRALLDSGNPHRAAEALKRALALDPENAVASHFAGEAAIANGEWVNAIKALKRARALWAPDEALDQRIAFVEERLAEIGQLEVPARPPRSAPVRPLPPPVVGPEESVFSVTVGDVEPEPGTDDVFAVGSGALEPPDDDEPPVADDGRTTVALPLAEMSIPRPQVEEPAAEPDEQPAFAPEVESPPAIDADAIIEAEGRDSDHTAIVPVSVAEVEPTIESEPDFDSDGLDEAEIEPPSEELPLPTMTLARLALDQGDLELAERTLRGVLDRDPGHAEATRLLAGLTAGAGADVPAGEAVDETEDARAQALRRWLEAVRLASERLQA
jgi:tetratricopeptide (TPR) repeat protein